MGEIILDLSGYTVSFSGKTILKNIDLRIPDRGMTVLMGPSGTGKSTLLRTLAGVNDASSSIAVSGQSRYRGVELGLSDRPAIVMQKTRLMRATLRENLVSELPERESLLLSQQRDLAVRMLDSAGLSHLADSLDRCVIDVPVGDQRLVAILRTVAANPKMLLVDEPTAGIASEQAERILAYLAEQAKKRAVVTVLHNQQHARQLGGTTVLLAGGHVVEIQPTENFLKTPLTVLGRDFIRTGSCCAPSPDVASEDLDEEYLRDLEHIIRRTETGRSEPVEPSVPSAHTEGRAVRSDAFGPRGFLWLRKGQLAGTPRPGLIQDLELDLAALQRVGVSVLVSLESEVPRMPIPMLERFGIKGFYLPIPDMEAPSLEAAAVLCDAIARLVDAGEAVALHCKAGLGRTGTMLVACLVWKGMSAMDALAEARRIEPRWVQSQEQVEFVRQFEKFTMTTAAVSSPAYMLA
jgi:atypical dual specificity phosphatase